MGKLLIVIPSLMAKSHIVGYTKKDGTYVAPHDDKRSKSDKPKNTRSKSASKSSSAMPNKIRVGGVMRSTSNSLGQKIHPTESGVRKFWEWFGDSKAIDGEGRPLVLYHGTNKDFVAFDEKQAGSSGIPKTGKDKVMFFSDSQWEANNYANMATDYKAYNSANAKERNVEYELGEVARQMDRAGETNEAIEERMRFLRKEKMPKTSAKEASSQGKNVVPVYLNIQNPLIDDVKGRVSTNSDRVKKALKVIDDGDGIILNNVRSFNDVQDTTNHYLVFKPEQVKSAIGNNGDFSGDERDMTKSMLVISLVRL